jgi:hypothetical protein
VILTVRIPHKKKFLVANGIKFQASIGLWGDWMCNYTEGDWMCVDSFSTPWGLRKHSKTHRENNA